MSDLLLSKAERERFAAWLEREAESDKQIAEQAQKLGAPGSVIAQRNKIHAAACLIVAAQLRATEDASI